MRGGNVINSPIFFLLFFCISQTKNCRQIWKFLFSTENSEELLFTKIKAKNSC